MSISLDLPPLVLERQRIASSDSVRERLPYIDGLRAVALLGIVALYVVTLVPTLFGPGQASLARIFLGAGSHGIELFFVISGFCLAYPVLKVLRGDRSVGVDVARYAVKRIVRIIPPYYAALAVLVIPPLIAARLGHPLPLISAPSSTANILKQVLFLDGGTKFVNPSFWTLCLLVRWYILFPFAIALWIKSPRAFGLAMVGAAIAASFTQTRSLDLAFLPAFLLGVVAADLRVQPLRFQGLIAILVPILVLAAYLAEVSTSPSIGYRLTIPPNFEIETNILWQLAAFSAIIAAGEARIFERILGSRLLGSLAVIAYSLFLVFEPVFAAILQLLGARLGVPVAAAVAALGALAASIAFWRFFASYFEASTLRIELIDATTPAFARLFRSVGIPSALVFHDSALTEFPDPAAIAARAAVEEFSRDEQARIAQERSERHAAEERQRQEAAESRRQRAEERVRRTHEEADRRAAAERERKEREESERRAAEERAQKERAENERRAAEQRAAEHRARLEREEAERRAAEQRAAEERARKEREEAERRAAEERAQKEREEAERRAAEERARKEREEAERRAAEERAQKEREEAQRRAAEERARQEREEAERRVAEERARKEREEAERRAAEERAQKEREEAQRRAAEERARQEREEAERRAAEERARQEREEAERRAAEQRAAEERARQEREEAERRAAEERALQEREAAERRAAEQRAAEERARQEREEAERRAAEQRAAEQRAAEEQARKEREDAERRAAEERARKEREEAERLATEQRAADERTQREHAAADMRRSAEETKRRELAELERQAAARRAAEVDAARQRIDAEWKAAQERAHVLRSEAEAQSNGSDRSSSSGPLWAHRLLERLGRRPPPPEPEGPQFSVAERISRDFGTIQSSTSEPSPPVDGEGSSPTQ